MGLDEQEQRRWFAGFQLTKHSLSKHYMARDNNPWKPVESTVYNSNRQQKHLVHTREITLIHLMVAST
jgi:hypothetical protein